MGPDPFIGVIDHWLGGFAAATNFIPFRGIKRWSWEIYWLIQGVAAWLIAPLFFASLLVPHLFHILAIAPRASIGYTILFGILWGVGGLSFGLAIRYLGIVLGYAIALGLSIFFGIVVPPIVAGRFSTIAHEPSGQVILAGVALCLVATAFNAAAGYSKEREITPAEKARTGERDFAVGKGLAVAIFAGLLSSFFAYGLAAGAPIAAIASTELLTHHRLDLWQSLPVLVVVLWGAFLTNFIWSAILIFRNRSVRQFAGFPGSNPMRASHTSGDTLADFDPTDRTFTQMIAPATLTRNYAFAALAGIIWYLQFFFYSMGQTRLGKYDFSSWTLHMASIILCATLWGVALREWRGTSRRTRVLVATGLFLLVSATGIVGYGNYIKANRQATHTTATR